MSEFRRRLMMAQGGGVPLPYDSKVEYLGANRDAWIDTGLKSSANVFEYDFVVACENSSTTNHIVIGADRGFNVSANSNKYRATGQCISTVTSDINTFVHIVFSCNPTARTISLVIDNNSFSGVYSSFSYNNTVGIFGFSDYNKLHGKIKSASIKLNGVLVRDYIPVRVGTTGYMYDKVTRQLYGNAGTGAFTYGNDIN